jgi:hypothetical protein
MTCENCHSFMVCNTIAQFSRQLLFSTNIHIHVVRPVLVSLLAENCELYLDKGKISLDRKTKAAGPDA